MASWSLERDVLRSNHWPNNQWLRHREIRVPIHDHSLPNFDRRVDCYLLHRKLHCPFTHCWHSFWYSVGHLPNADYQLRIRSLPCAATRLLDNLGERLLGHRPDYRRRLCERNKHYPERLGIPYSVFSSMDVAATTSYRCIFGTRKSLVAGQERSH